MALAFLFLVLILHGFVKSSNAYLEFLPMPQEMISCFNYFHQKCNLTNAVGHSLNRHCVNSYYFHSDKIKWEWTNLTDFDIHYLNFLRRRLFDNHFRGKRQSDINPSPPTGFRVRKEYRRLTDSERTAYHSVLNVMKRNGEYDTFARIHSGPNMGQFHHGPNFLGWHRIYLSYFEEAVRRYDNSLSLPFWDYTMDFPLSDPTQSVLWSATFLGNGDGVVWSGPFSGWVVNGSPLIRNIGHQGALMSKQDVDTVLTRCDTSEITFPREVGIYNLEMYHNRVHNWVGGNMEILDTAAFDPAFFLHHAFVDYVWELFRLRQLTVCQINPEANYPNAVGDHAPQREMHAFPHHRASDGYANYWTDAWYTYEMSPTCTRVRPDCGSLYLKCDIDRDICVSKTRSEIATSSTSPTQRPRRKRRSLVLETPSSCTGAISGTMQNTYFINGNNDIDSWVFIPIQIAYVRPSGYHFHSYPIQEGKVQYVQDVYSPFLYSNLHSYVKSEDLKAYPNCGLDPSGAGQIYVRSDGLTYYGTYVDYVLSDVRQPYGSTVVYIGVKHPGSGTSEAILSAHDKCGRPCSVTCANANTDPPSYKRCSGVIRLSSRLPLMYGSSYGDAVLSAWDPLGMGPEFNSIHVVVICNYRDIWPW
ncbi:hypothetical protein ACJMK2_010904 [Sinanodonta woodiana]|uniref:Tyrosinase copper-binding domain-containing protein n=1 Tax=Sinanodonta woodiana TaxID=1069815 RepID=A0ABD3VGY9_SINWO